MVSYENLYRAALRRILAEASETRHSWKEVAEAREEIKRIARAALDRDPTTRGSA